MKRDVYIVGPRKNADTQLRPWVLTFNKAHVADFQTQVAAIEHAVSLARYRLAETGRVSELRIKGNDGKIRDSRTYGRDPRGTKG